MKMKHLIVAAAVALVPATASLADKAALEKAKAAKEEAKKKAIEEAKEKAKAEIEAMTADVAGLDTAVTDVQSQISKEEYLDDIDIVKLFLDECVILTCEEHDKLKTSELYRVFREVFKTRGEDAMSIKEFAKALERHILQKKNKNWRIDVYSKNQMEIPK